MTWIDLSHTFTNDMPTYPGDPAPQVKQWASVEKDGFTDHTIHSGMHVGTHIDGPAHMIAGGEKLCDFPTERFITPAKLLDLNTIRKENGTDTFLEKGNPHADTPLFKGGQGGFSITRQHLETTQLEADNALLIRADFSKYFGQPEYFTDYPTLTEEAAHYLVEKKIGILGIDWCSPDRDPFPVHKILLGSNILIIENLTNLETLPVEESFTLYTFPMKIDADSAPARVIAHL